MTDPLRINLKGIIRMLDVMKYQKNISIIFILNEVEITQLTKIECESLKLKYSQIFKLK